MGLLLRMQKKRLKASIDSVDVSGMTASRAT